MKDFYIGDCLRCENKVITSSFVVAAKQVKPKKTGDPYLALTLADRTGQIEAKMWDNVAEAIDAFEHCLRIDPHYNAAHYRLAVCYFHAGRLEEALQQFESSLTLTPEYLMAHYHIGVINERRGAYAAAEHAFERSQEEGVGEVSSLFHLAAILRTRGDEQGARRLLQRAREFAQAKVLAD